MFTRKNEVRASDILAIKQG